MITSVLRGDTEQFRHIVTRYEGLVFRLALSRLRDREVAADATQEIFLRVFRFLPRFRRGSTFLPWLYTIALNYLRTVQGRRGRIRSREAPLDAERAQADRYRDPSQLAAEAEEVAQVRAAVARLPAKLRDVASLYYLDELSVDETAKLIGISTENAKSRLHRARARLRTLLLRKGGG
ncbi:RNA polymerase sigma factor [Salinispira pacifica]